MMMKGKKKLIESGIIDLRKAMKKVSNSSDVPQLMKYFKTGKGEYAEGDMFIGIRMPVLRKVATEMENRICVDDIDTLIQSKIHEERMIALLFMIRIFGRKKTDSEERQRILEIYINNFKTINNWDLVDTSAPCITGRDSFENKKESKLYEWAKSDHLWTKRIAMLSCMYYIKKDSYDVPLKVATILVNDDHDLIHKAVGWMLREIGKRDMPTEEGFLHKHYKEMPRTMLRYATEKFPEPLRLQYLKGEI